MSWEDDGDNPTAELSFIVTLAHRCVNWVLMPAIGASEWRSGISAVEVEREKLVRRSHDEEFMASMGDVDTSIDE